MIYSNLTHEEKSRIYDEISVYFEESMLNPRKDQIVDFIISFVNSNESNENINNYEYNLFYYANSPLSHITIEDTIGNESVLKLEYYHSGTIEQMVQSYLHKNNIDYSDTVVNEEFDTFTFWEDQGMVEEDFFIKCFKKAGEKLDTKIKCILVSSDGSGDLIDLNTSKRVDHFFATKIPKKNSDIYQENWLSRIKNIFRKN